MSFYYCKDCHSIIGDTKEEGILAGFYNDSTENLPGKVLSKVGVRCYDCAIKDMYHTILKCFHPLEHKRPTTNGTVGRPLPDSTIYAMRVRQKSYLLSLLQEYSKRTIAPWTAPKLNVYWNKESYYDNEFKKYSKIFENLGLHLDLILKENN